MRWLMVSLCISAAALADPTPLSIRIVLPRQQLSLDSVFENAIHAAGFAIDAGRLAFTRHGKPLAVKVGRATLSPLVDLGFGGASIVIRIAF